MASEGIKFAFFLHEWLATSVKCANFLPKGAIFKIKCKKQSGLLFVVNMKFFSDLYS